MTEPPTTDELEARLAELEIERESAILARALAAKEARELAGSIEAQAQALAKRRFKIGLAVLLGIVVAGGGAGYFVWNQHHAITGETLAGEVVAAEGTSPVRRGERCRVAIEPNSMPNAYVRVTCGDLRLYGHDSFGQVQCESEGGRVTRCVDDRTIAFDGDPTLEIDRARRAMALDDGPGWRVVVALD
jgi:hypothetical protein